MKSLQLSSFNPNSNEWGIVMMLIQANLPDTVPGQNVNLLLFGNVDIEQTSPSQALLPTEIVTVKSSENLNVRSAPSSEATIVEKASPGQQLTANARLENSSWIRVQLPSGVIGWISSQWLESNAPLYPLKVIDPNNSQDINSIPEFGTMQAFYFSSGIGDAPCQTAPESGILIHTPTSNIEIAFAINEVLIEVGSTLFVQAISGQEMIISVLEGQITVTALNTKLIAPAGTRIRVPIDENNRASGPPIALEPYSTEIITQIPTTHLPETTDFVPAMTAEQLAPFLTYDLPLSAEWEFTALSDEYACPPPFSSQQAPETGAPTTWIGTITVAPDNTYIDYQSRFNQVAPNMYMSEASWEFGGRATMTIEFTSPDQLIFTRQGLAPLMPAGILCVDNVVWEAKLIDPP